MSGLGLLSNYNYESDPSDPDDTETPSASKTQSENGNEKLHKLSKESVCPDKSKEQEDKHADRSSENSAGKSDGNSDEKNKDKHVDRTSSSDESRANRNHGVRSSDNLSRDDRNRGDKSRDDKYKSARSRDREDKRRMDHTHHKRDDRSGRDHERSRDYKRRDNRGGRDFRGRGYRGRDHRTDFRHRSASQEAKDREFEEYRRKKYGDSRDWGKVSAESLKDVKTDSTLPTSFDNTIAKQLAAQREKRKLLWGKKEDGEGSTSSQKGAWGTGCLKNDETGEQTAKFLKLMGVRDVTADNLKDYKKSDESVLRSSEAVNSMENEYEKSRYMQHINKGVGLGMIQFTKPPPPT
ncbi:uncharacterized protein LOC134812757 isoform X3 [Bolinopsis microptera]|uniref:uncharacterized protein LOC134812757 isoform X3 n=1 Tax=Bolinopsis microptera TaxID=2820187 RepID=UPI003079631D